VILKDLFKKVILKIFFKSWARGVDEIALNVRKKRLLVSVYFVEEDNGKRCPN